MTGDLMAPLTHADDELLPGKIRVIDWTLAAIDAGHKECRLCIVLIQQIEDVVSVAIRAIVESQSHRSRNSARADDAGTPGSVTMSWAWNMVRWRAGRGLARIASAKVDQTVWRAAMVCSDAAVAFSGQYLFLDDDMSAYPTASSNYPPGSVRMLARIGLACQPTRPGGRSE